MKVDLGPRGVCSVTICGSGSGPGHWLYLANSSWHDCTPEEDEKCNARWHELMG
jgi:hypothetical protein